MATEGPRVALVGCGRWGRNIARALSRLGALEVIVDPAASSQTDFAAELSARVSADLTEAFAAGIDGVAIAAPAVDHARLAQQALERGKAVFVEKPLALTVEDAEHVAVAARRVGRPLMVGHLLQYHPAFVTMRRMVAAGAIGDLRHVSSNRLNPGAIRNEETALWSMGPHDFSMILGLMGVEPTIVSALPVRIVDPTVPDQYHVQMAFPGGRTASVQLSWLSPFKEHKLTVLGTSGALVFEDTAREPEHKLVYYPDYIDRGGPMPRFNKGAGVTVPYEDDEPLIQEMKAFLAECRGDPGSVTGPDEAIPVLRLLQMAEAETKRYA